MAHVLVVPHPNQGHINPMLQFSKHLATKGPKITLVTTLHIINSIKLQAGPISIAAISDGYDEGGVSSAPNLEVYLESLGIVGSETLEKLIEEFNQSDNPITCIVYDTLLPWTADVARKLGLPSVGFSTQSCAVSAIYYYVNKVILEVPESGNSVLGFGLPPMVRSEFPSFSLGDGSYPTLVAYAMSQFNSGGKDDWVLFNSFDALENEVTVNLNNYFHARNIGPCVPRHSDAHDLNLLEPEEDTCVNWLSTKPIASVIYVSFGSLAVLSPTQMEELLKGLKSSNKYFLWVVRAPLQETLPQDFQETLGEKGLIITWSPQLKVLTNKAIGCFITHCGWNSTLEAVNFGVPMVAMAQWTDQPTNAKYIEDVWRVGVRARVDERGIVRKEEVKRCVEEVMDGERGDDIRKNAKRFKEQAKEAIGEGGSSDRNINEFVDYLNAMAEKKKMV
ncbi:hypothetical protein LUZ60_005314 [Juncus effusus]|nr:hypothetical protein LUZ60_005314 [Juncus effusus]